MANAVLSRDSGASVTIPIIEAGGSLAVARDVGKPSAQFNAVGTEDPIPQDHFSAQDRFTVIGTLHDSSAYADAQTLAEDVIKPQFSDSDALTLDLSDLPSRGTYEVAPDQAGACQITYAPGRRNWLEVQLSLAVVNSTFGGGGQQAQSTISPDSGTGIKLTDGSNPVTLNDDLTVTRAVGRPGANLIQLPQSVASVPNFYDLNKPASDVFEFSGAHTASAAADTNTLEETLIRAAQGTGALTLHFLDNLYSLDAYNVLPEGSQAYRSSFSTGQTGVVRSETLSLRVVDPP